MTTQPRIVEELIGLRRRLAELVASANDAATLQQNERLARRYQDFVDNLPDVVVELDKDARIASVNQQIVAVFGYSPQALIGKPFEILLHPDENRGRGSTLIDFLKSEKETQNELRGRRKEGNEVWVRATVAHSGSDILPTAVVILTDVTERVKMAQALLESEQKYRALFGASPDSIALLDLQGRVLDSNRFLGFLGIPLEAAKGKHFKEIGVVPPEYAEYYDVLMAEVAAGKRIGPVEIKIRDLENNDRWIEVYASQITTEGKPFAIQVISRNINERKKLEEQLIQSQKMEAVGQLAGGLAHDFNNQLTVILNAVEILKRSLNKDEPSLEIIDLIKSAAKHSVDLTQQLLDFSRKQIVRPIVLNLNHVLDHLRPMLVSSLGEDVELLFQLDNALGAIRIDPAQVHRVIVNLILNSRDAMPDGGVITVKTANTVIEKPIATRTDSLAPGRYVTLSVADTGCGIDAQTLSRLFEPFFTTKEPGKGTGLGLATVYGVVKQSGGEIGVESEPGSGTVFTIFLPRVDKEVVQEEVEQPFSDVPHDAITVLLIEDDRKVRETTEMLLTASGLKVITAHNPGEALLLFESRHREIDVVLSDVVMPGMRVKELTAQMTRIEPSVKILFVSGYSEQVVVERGVVDPEIHFLRKPFTIDELLNKITTLLAL
jgi:two-component system, cell cycle sensor histidine kinase and response regulator CckA